MYLLAGMVFCKDRNSFYCKPFADVESANAHLAYLKVTYPELNTNLLRVSSGDEMDKSLEVFYNL